VVGLCPIVMEHRTRPAAVGQGPRLGESLPVPRTDESASRVRLACRIASADRPTGVRGTRPGVSTLLGWTSWLSQAQEERQVDRGAAVPAGRGGAAAEPSLGRGKVGQDWLAQISLVTFTCRTDQECDVDVTIR